MVRAGQGLEPGALRLSASQFDVAAVTKLSDAVTPALQRAQQIAADVAALPTQTWSGTVDDARAEMSTALDTLLTVVRPAANALRIAPQLLGATTPQRYFVAFLNNAEARGLGGLPGAFGILVADKGTLSFEHLGTDDELLKLTADVDLPAEYDKAWADWNPAGQYLNSDVDAHFPYAAAIWAGMWQQKTGEPVTAAMALDPTALSYLLGATGAATTDDGTAVTAEDVVELTQKAAYDTFGDDQAARKAFLISVAAAVEKQVIGGGGSLTALVNAGAKSADEGRLLLWSADPAVERVLASGAIGGVVPQDEEPYAGLVVNNAAANKLDYYLSSSLTWKRAGCGATRSVTVTLTFTNDAPASGLTSYVAGEVDGAVGNGDSKVLVDYLATSGATLRAATLNGAPVAMRAETERGHPVYRLPLALPRGATQTVVLQLQEPAGSREVVVRPAPLITPVTVKVDDAACS